MGFQLSGLPVEAFAYLFGLPDDALRRQNVQRLVAEPSFPCRLSLIDAAVGEPVLLLSYEHLPVASPYRASGPIFVRETARETAVFTNEVPFDMRKRLFSVRGYDEAGEMLDADVAEGTVLETLIERLFENRQISYLHLHHARRGCFACRADRA